MGKIITVANQKGGVGKTTTAIAITQGFASKYKTLLIDLDPQCNATDNFTQSDSKGIEEVLFNNQKPQEYIIQTEKGDILPGSLYLHKADTIMTDLGKEYCLKKALSEIDSEYDYIIIDTPPSLGVLLINALTAADEVIIPINADRYSLSGMNQLKDTINSIREYTNSKLEVRGILLTQYNKRLNISKSIIEVLPRVVHQFDTVLFDTAIRSCTATKEAQARKQGLFEYAPDCNSAIDYQELIHELKGESK